MECYPIVGGKFGELIVNFFELTVCQQGHRQGMIMNWENSICPKVMLAQSRN
jgi:hypothetical protein